MPARVPRTDPPIRSVPDAPGRSSGSRLARAGARRGDPRVVRTRATLQLGLLDLVQRHRWEKITVQLLLDRTGVSRSTFYAHYDGKLDVLTSGITELTGNIFLGPPGEPPDLLPLFTHVDEMRELFHALLHQPVLGDIVELFHRALVVAWKRYLSLGRSDTSVKPEVLAGATVAALRAYAAERRRSATPERAASELARLLVPVVAA